MIGNSPGKKCSIAVVMAVLLLAPATARAQMFVSGLLGGDFGGDSGCPQLTNCSDKKLNEGVAIGAVGLIGFEEELGYAKDFFGSAPGLSSSVLTLMSNVMVAPKIGPVHPYGLVGLGLIRTHTELSASSLLDVSVNDNNVGWDVGGGAIVFVLPHVGIRGDLRYFHALQNLTIGGVTLSSPKLDFGRAGAGIVISF